MNILRNFVYCLLITSLYWAVSCDGGDDDPGLPNPLKFTLSSATFNGSDINPLPSYTLNITYDEDGTLTSYTATGSGQFTPTPTNSGDVSPSGNSVTFTSGSNSRTVSITGGTLSQSSTTVTLRWELTKVDDGVTAEEQGTYVFVMEVE
jgi:hypothetical protein